MTEVFDGGVSRVLDWRSRHDPRSRGYAAVDLVRQPVERRYRTWRAPLWLDQGSEGACVGFSASHALASSPFRLPGVTNESARALYRAAQKLDPWPGEDYEGTSVLAGAQAALQAGLIRSYHWAFGVDDLREVLLGSSGAIIGVPWLAGMFRPRPSGLLDVSGPVRGGHAIYVRGFNENRRLPRDGKGPMFTLRNSWGQDWGVRGDAYIRDSDLGYLLSDSGEACVFRR